MSITMSIYVLVPYRAKTRIYVYFKLSMKTLETICFSFREDADVVKQIYLKVVLSKLNIHYRHLTSGNNF